MAEDKSLVTLEDVLLSAERLPYQMELFLQRDVLWQADTVGALLDPGDYGEDEDTDRPQFAQERGLSVTLGVSEIQEVVSNAREQDPSVGVEQLVKAFTFYWQNDAFIDFGAG